MSAAGDSTDRVEEVRAANDIVGVIGAYVRLRKAGRSYKGLCPFHKEKTPSFHVSPERQTFHCFGCGKGGDVFRFLMEIDGVRFPEALRSLAQRAGIRIPDRADPRATERRERLYQVLESAARFYRASLRTAGASAARGFLESRGLSDEIVERFGLGYAPSGWRTLRERARAEGFTDEELTDAGLAVQRPDSAPYDRFRERLVFPILTVGGRTVGFGGRILGEGEPKYLNSPETDLFRKGDGLYGLSVTRHDIRREGTAVLVEGYTDLLAVYQAGFRNVAAPLGTAFTGQQARLLANYTERVLVLFDGDEAGLQATLRSLATLAGEGLSPSIAELPAGSDPDELLRESGAEALRLRMESALPLVPFLLERAYSGDREAGIRALVRVLVPMRDELRLSLLVREAHERSGIPEEVIHREVLRLRKGTEEAEPRAIRTSPVASRRLMEAERGIAYLGYELPDLLPVIRRALGSRGVEDPPARKLLEALYECAEKGEDPTESVFTLRDVDGEFARLRMESDAESDPLHRLRDYVACVWEEEINRRLRRVQDELKDAEERKDLEACSRLLEKRAALANRKRRIAGSLRDEDWDAHFRSAERSE
ncbi:MAG: DNA primase [Candidatus Eisenbacteria bacterium]